MDDRELYEKRRQAELEEWQAEIDKLKAKAEQASVDAQLELDRRIGAIESRIEQGKALLSDLAEAGEEGWDEARARVDGAWDALAAGAEEAAEEISGE